jgi:Isoprenylcysteine carboxyl methyltransferase (ICMT) family
MPHFPPNSALSPRPSHHQGSTMMSPIVRFLLAIVGSAFYLGLAVLGWGGVAAFFSNPARTALAVVTLLIGIAAFFAGGSLSRGVREDRSNRWVIVALTIIGLVAGYLPALTDRLNFWTIDGNAVRWLGVALFAVGGALRLWPVYVLGHRFSGLVAIQPGHVLLTTGIYSVIRHPSYLGLFVNALGWGRWSVALSRKSGCCSRSSAANTTPIAPAPRGSFRGCGRPFGRRGTTSSCACRMAAPLGFSAESTKCWLGSLPGALCEVGCPRGLG